MNFFDYKYFHILMVIIFLYNLLVSIYNPNNKILKIILGFNTLILLGSGFMLMERLAIPLGGTYPMWIYAKIGIWFLLAIIPPIMIKRAPTVTQKISFLFLLLVLLASFLGVYKVQ